MTLRLPLQTVLLDVDGTLIDSNAAHAESTVMIGDTPYDIEASRRAGISAIAWRCGGYWDDSELQGALAIFDDPAGLLEHW